MTNEDITNYQKNWKEWSMSDYEQVADLYELKILVKKFFKEYLDVVEVSDSGTEFHPIMITCCRAMKIDPLKKLLKRLRELSLEEN